MDTKEALDDLKGIICKSCSNSKVSMRSHCKKCYFRLPPKMRKNLYKKLREGYEEAYADSLTYLKENY